MKKFVLSLIVMLGLMSPAVAQHQTPKGPLDDITQFSAVFACGPFVMFKRDIIDPMGFLPILASQLETDDGRYIYIIFTSKKEKTTIVTVSDKFNNICVLNAIQNLTPIDPHYENGFSEERPDKKL